MVILDLSMDASDDDFCEKQRLETIMFCRPWSVPLQRLLAASMSSLSSFGWRRGPQPFLRMILLMVHSIVLILQQFLHMTAVFVLMKLLLQKMVLI